MEELRKVVYEERAKREKLQTWIQDTLRPTLQKQQAVNKQGFQTVNAKIDQKDTELKKLLEWLSGNIGIKLEKIDELIDNKIAEEKSKQSQQNDEHNSVKAVEEVKHELEQELRQSEKRINDRLDQTESSMEIAFEHYFKTQKALSEAKKEEDERKQQEQDSWNKRVEAFMAASLEKENALQELLNKSTQKVEDLESKLKVSNTKTQKQQIDFMKKIHSLIISEKQRNYENLSKLEDSFKSQLEEERKQYQNKIDETREALVTEKKEFAKKFDQQEQELAKQTEEFGKKLKEKNQELEKLRTEFVKKFKEQEQEFASQKEQSVNTQLVETQFQSWRDEIINSVSRQIETKLKAQKQNAKLDMKTLGQALNSELTKKIKLLQTTNQQLEEKFTQFKEENEKKWKQEKKEFFEKQRREFKTEIEQEKANLASKWEKIISNWKDQEKFMKEVEKSRKEWETEKVTLREMWRERAEKNPAVVMDSDRVWDRRKKTFKPAEDWFFYNSSEVAEYNDEPTGKKRKCKESSNVRQKRRRSESEKKRMKEKEIAEDVVEKTEDQHKQTSPRRTQSIEPAQNVVSENFFDMVMQPSGDAEEIPILCNLWMDYEKNDPTSVVALKPLVKRYVKFYVQQSNYEQLFPLLDEIQRQHSDWLVELHKASLDLVLRTALPSRYEYIVELLHSFKARMYHLQLQKQWKEFISSFITSYQSKHTLIELLEKMEEEQKLPQNNTNEPNDSMNVADHQKDNDGRTKQTQKKRKVKPQQRKQEQEHKEKQEQLSKKGKGESEELEAIQHELKVEDKDSRQKEHKEKEPLSKKGKEEPEKLEVIQQHEQKVEEIDSSQHSSHSEPQDEEHKENEELLKKRKEEQDSAYSEQQEIQPIEELGLEHSGLRVETLTKNNQQEEQTQPADNQSSMPVEPSDDFNDLENFIKNLENDDVEEDLENSENEPASKEVVKIEQSGEEPEEFVLLEKSEVLEESTGETGELPEGSGETAEEIKDTEEIEEQVEEKQESAEIEEVENGHSSEGTEEFVFLEKPAEEEDRGAANLESVDETEELEEKGQGDKEEGQGEEEDEENGEEDEEEDEEIKRIQAEIRLLTQTTEDDDIDLDEDDEIKKLEEELLLLQTSTISESEESSEEDEELKKIQAEIARLEAEALDDSFVFIETEEDSFVDLGDQTNLLENVETGSLEDGEVEDFIEEKLDEEEDVTQEENTTLDESEHFQESDDQTLTSETDQTNQDNTNLFGDVSDPLFANEPQGKDVEDTPENFFGDSEVEPLFGGYEAQDRETKQSTEDETSTGLFESPEADPLFGAETTTPENKVFPQDNSAVESPLSDPLFANEQGKDVEDTPENLFGDSEVDPLFGGEISQETLEDNPNRENDLDIGEQTKPLKDNPKEDSQDSDKSSLFDNPDTDPLFGDSEGKDDNDFDWPDADPLFDWSTDDIPADARKIKKKTALKKKGEKRDDKTVSFDASTIPALKLAGKNSPTPRLAHPTKARPIQTGKTTPRRRKRLNDGTREQFTHPSLKELEPSRQEETVNIQPSYSSGSKSMIIPRGARPRGGVGFGQLNLGSVQLKPAKRRPDSLNLGTQQQQQNVVQNFRGMLRGRGRPGGRARGLGSPESVRMSPGRGGMSPESGRMPTGGSPGGGMSPDWVPMSGSSGRGGIARGRGRGNMGFPQQQQQDDSSSFGHGGLLKNKSPPSPSASPVFSRADVSPDAKVYPFGSGGKRSKSMFVPSTSTLIPKPTVAKKQADSPVADLFHWAKTKLLMHGKGVDITNFTTSWKDGKAFCALARQCGAKIDWNDVLDGSDESRLEMAFAAFAQMGVPRLLDVPDILALRVPEKLSMITYISEIRRRV